MEVTPQRIPPDCCSAVPLQPAPLISLPQRRVLVFSLNTDSPFCLWCNTPLFPSNLAKRAMEILVNGTPHLIPDNTTVAQLLVILALQGKRLALEVNQTLVPRSQFETFTLKPNDTVEIVHAIGGG